MERGVSLKELQQELKVLEAFNETRRAKILRAIIESELTKKEQES